jgi:hypothetical protein
MPYPNVSGLEQEQRQQHQRCLQALAAGVDPQSGELLEEASIVNRLDIARTLNYACGLLSGERHSRSSSRSGASAVAAFYLNPEQKEELVGMFAETTRDRFSRSDLASAINQFVADNGCKKFQAAWITKWLEGQGHLYKRAERELELTELGRALGVSVERVMGAGGQYDMPFLNKQAAVTLVRAIDEVVPA